MDCLPNSLTPLCFSRGELTRPGFQVDEFLAGARAHVSLDQLKDHLHLYLKILQNAMIELINKDYAQFVSLSSNLVSLSSGLHKLQADLGDMTGHFHSCTDRLTQIADSLNGRLSDRQAANQRAEQLRCRILAMKTMGKIRRLVIGPPSESRGSGPGAELSPDILERIVCLIADVRECLEHSGATSDEKLSSVYRAVLAHFVRRLDDVFLAAVKHKKVHLIQLSLTAYQVCDHVAGAEALFIAEFVEQRMTKCLAGQRNDRSLTLSTKLGQCLSLLEIIFGEFSPNFQHSAESPSIFGENSPAKNSANFGVKFLLDCILTNLLSVIDAAFGDLAIPTLLDEFLACYRLLVENFVVTFERQWSIRLESHSIFRSVRTRFSTGLYFQLRRQEIREEIDKSAAMSTANEIKVGGASFHCAMTQTTADWLARIWSDHVFLDKLAPRFWHLSCELLHRYGGWLDQRARGFQADGQRPEAQQNGHSTAKPAETAVADQIRPRMHILADCGRLQKEIGHIFETAIAPRLSAFVEPVEQSRFRATFSEIVAGFDESIILIRKSISDALTARLVSALSSVSEIPRQYRWTRKEAPSQPSAYLAHAFQNLNAFKTISESVSLDRAQISAVVGTTLNETATRYEESIREVLVSVDKIATSLSRLKKSASKSQLSAGEQVGSGKVGTPLTDDDKIRLQLALDVREFGKLVAQMDFGHLEHLGRLELMVCPPDHLTLNSTITATAKGMD